MTEAEKLVFLSCMQELQEYDTPTVSNAVATYPGKATCLSLFDPHETLWYTDDHLHSLYPDLGARCGFAVTCVYGVPSGNEALGMADVLQAIAAVNAPVILVMKQNMPEGLTHRSAMIGGNMLTAFSGAGAVGVIGDGPARDVQEMKPLNVPCLFSGLTAAHGPADVEAVNVPVSVASMDVVPMDVIHMDANGAIRFPARYLPEIARLAKEIQRADEKRQRMLRSTTSPEKLGQYMKEVYD